MIKSLPNVLESPPEGYSIFEANQVLASDHLNSLAAYGNYQEQLTRARLIGVGIIGGLQVTLSGQVVQIGAGAGVSTDGDLLSLDVATTYDKFKNYGAAAPRYSPFVVDGKMLEISELVKQDTADNAAKSLSEFPGSLGEMVVVMFVERYADDPDLCTGADCDNLGQTAVANVRMLLVSRDDASTLLGGITTISDAASKLPVVEAARPVFSPATASAKDLRRAFRVAAERTRAALGDALDMLPRELSEFVRRVFGREDPSPAWRRSLAEQSKPDKDELNAQYYYDHLKDLAETWNALRDQLLDDRCVLCPSVKPFPRHLLLGDLGNPRELRTGWFPSRSTCGDRNPAEHAIFLARKLDEQINKFAIPGTGAQIRITPSYREDKCLEERAIPYYYPAALSQWWSFRRAHRRETGGILGYHTSSSDVFTRQIGRYDFFRVEGHLGAKVAEAHRKIANDIASNNLPFTVRAVLLHNSRDKLLIRPDIRFGDLHRLHQLLRKELTVQLTDTRLFNDGLQKKLEDAEKKALIQPQSPDRAGLLGRVSDAASQAASVLAHARFADYTQARDSQDWRSRIETIVNTAASIKGSVSTVAQNNYASVFDALLTSNHPAWLDWLESLIQSQNAQEDDKLLFRSFCERHPGLEHCGGVPRGGTLVLIYDDSGDVVADFALDYVWHESAENEPQELAALVDPTYREPTVVQHSMSFAPSLSTTIDDKLRTFDATLKGGLLKDQIESQNRQLDYLKQFVQTVGSRSTTSRTFVDPNQVIADPLIRSMVDELNYRQRLVEDLRTLAADPATPAESRTRAATELDRVEKELADSVTRSTKFLTTSGTKLDPGTDGAKAVMAISNSLQKISSPRLLAPLGDVSRNLTVAPIKQVFTLRGL